MTMNKICIFFNFYLCVLINGDGKCEHDVDGIQKSFIAVGKI